MNILLSGIVGSTAYGLAGPDSDIDRLGIFAAPTEDLLGLTQPPETHATTHPDVTRHEAAKFCRLALGCNPTIMELLWLPSDLYEVHTALGEELVSLRRAFLSAQRVRDAYYGYAYQQFKRLKDRQDGSFSSDTRKRTAKHATHLARLLHQGLALYSTGELTVRLENPGWYRSFSEKVLSDPNEALYELNLVKALFDKNGTVLPDKPDVDSVNRWLLKVRRTHLSEWDRR